jgi:PAS domain S-box-containing protein
MNILSMVHFTAFWLCIGLIFIVLKKNPKATLNRVCVLLFTCFAIWEISLTFFYGAVSQTEAMLWTNIASFGWSYLAGFYLWFALIFTNRESILKKWYFYGMVFWVPLVFIVLQWTGYLISGFIKQFFWWEIVWSSSIWSWIFYIYYLSSLAGVLYLGIRLIMDTSALHVKKQARLLVITGLINIILAFINNLLFPILKIPNVPVTSAIMTLIWSGGIVYAITKYKLMILTPAYAASNIIATMGDSLILIDPEGILVETNHATLKLLGYGREEIIGQPVGPLFAEEIPFWKEIQTQKSIPGDLLKDYQIRYRAKSGTMIPVSFSSAVMRDEEYNFLGVVGVARDMREILRLQESERECMVEKARANALQERTQELQNAYDQLKAVQAQLIQSEKMAAVGQLAGGVAHEINNPMGVILGFAQSIMKRIQEDDPLSMPLKSIEREAVRCKKLVGDLLSFSRVGKTPVELINIHQTIDETLSLIAVQVNMKNIQIIRGYSTGLPHITANKNQLQQVIMNLCTNAVDAMPAGGKITVNTRQQEGFFEIRISDTGFGMTPAIMQRIFEPFFTTKEPGKGTGLGLSLCYEIIQKHHGTIEVESESGKGTTFVIKLMIEQ